MKFLRNELEKHIKIKLPMSKLDSFFYVELISQSNQVFIGKKNKALIQIDRNHKSKYPTYLIQKQINKKIEL